MRYLRLVLLLLYLAWWVIVFVVCMAALLGIGYFLVWMTILQPWLLAFWAALIGYGYLQERAARPPSAPETPAAAAPAEHPLPAALAPQPPATSAEPPPVRSLAGAAGRFVVKAAVRAAFDIVKEQIVGGRTSHGKKKHH